MLRQRTTLLVVPAVAAVLGAGAASPATAQTVVTAPVQATVVMTPTVPVQVAPTTTVVMAPTAPPAPLSETVPAAPAITTVTTYWQPGHWNWNGTSWVWMDGAYMQRVHEPTVNSVWVQGQWAAQTDGSYLWMPAHWQD